MIIKCFLRRLRLNKSAIWKSACTITGFALTIWGFVSLFDPLNNVFPNDFNPFYKLLIGFLVLLIVFFLSLIIASLGVFCSNKICLGESLTKKRVYVTYSDLFSNEIVEKSYNEKCAIVVPVNRCFDTIVDDHIVSHNTLHGKALQKLYDEQIFTPETLNNTICDLLDRNNATYDDITLEEKPEGNRKRHTVGTVVDLRIDEKRSYYLLGLSSFDKHLNAQTSKADFVFAVQKLIEFCNQNAQGYPVILPLLGSGFSRTKIELNDILHFLVDAFAINKDIINNDFYIIVWRDDKDRVAIKELRKWK